MKYLNFMSVCILATLFVSCKTSETEINDGTTEVSFALTADGTHHKVKSDLAEEYVPAVDDFTVEVFKKEVLKDKRLYRDTYPNSTEKAIRLNAGSYYMLAYHGDALGVGFGKDYAYFQAKEPFEISAGQRKVSVSATAKLYNVKVAVKYGADLLKDYPNFLITLASDKTGAKGKLSYTASDASKEGFIPAGTLTFTLFQDKSQLDNATADENGNLKVTAFQKTIAVDPNDFITLNVNTKPAEGKLQVGIEIDKETEIVNDEVTISSTYVSTAEPIITLSEKLGSPLEFYEGEALSGAYVSVNSAAGYTHAYLVSDYFTSKGLDKNSVDLMNMTEAEKNIIDGLGITSTEMSDNIKFSMVDFSGISQKVKYEAEPFDATFTLNIVDNNDKSVTSAPFKIKIRKLVADVNVTAANAFARSFRGVTMTVNEGVPSKFALQYRTGDGEWTTVAPEKVEGNTLSFAKIGGSLTPETAYQFRSIYDSNAAEVNDKVVSVTTEAAAQVGNAGFEEWTTETLAITEEGHIKPTYRSLDWYLPYSSASDSWWAVTSKRSIVMSILATTEMCVKSFPTVAYSPKEYSEGNYSAHVYSVDVGRYNTDATPNTMFGSEHKTYAGELFIGEADDSGNHLEDGHIFESRPDKFTFKYKFFSYNNEKSYVELVFKDASDNVVFSKIEKDINSSSEWTTYECDMDWSDFTKKVSSIYICFKSTSSDSPSEKNGSTMEVAGNNYKGHFGSSLYIDDIQMIYE